MQHVLTGVAVLAALAFAPVWAQPGPNPGGSALSGPRATAAPPAAMAPSAMPPSSMSDTSSAMPPKHHRASHHASLGKMAGHHRGKGTQPSSGTANQLNQEELARLQAGNMSMPAGAPGMAPPSAAATRGPSVAPYNR
jgi:hypothetical protein